MDRILEFTGNNTLLVLALMISFFLLVFTELRRKASGLINIGPVDAVKLINDDAVVIDLRSAEAHARGHIVGARNVPADELEARLESLSPHKSQPIITVCDAGMTSTKAVQQLKAAGFETAFGLKGGMNGWAQDGLPVVTGKKTKAKGGKGQKRKGKKKKS